MTAKETGVADIKRAAYEIAWREYCSVPGLTPDETMFGPDKLRSYIQSMADTGELDPSQIAKSAMGMMRQTEQTFRSKARITISPVMDD
jgi:hypothetical protein